MRLLTGVCGEVHFSSFGRFDEGIGGDHRCERDISSPFAHKMPELEPVKHEVAIEQRQSMNLRSSLE